MKKQEINIIDSIKQLEVSSGLRKRRKIKVSTLFFILYFSYCSSLCLSFVSWFLEHRLQVNRHSEFGFHAIPKEWSLDAYRYIITSKETILRAYGVTIFVTIVELYEYIGGCTICISAFQKGF